MYSGFLKALLVFAPSLFAVEPAVLRVCADPNNLPFSNQRGEGFENRLATLMARELGARLEYTWFSQRRSFLKNSLGEDHCDVVMGVPSDLDTVTVTRPYYRSTYVFLSRHDRRLHIQSLQDPRLASLRIGVHIVGSGYAPPAAALAQRGLAANVHGYSLYGPIGEENPPAKLVDAVAAGDVDVAIVWGPFAGYFARQEKTPLEVAPVSPSTWMAVPFTFSISMAVRKGDTALQERLDAALERKCEDIEAILKAYGVPQVSMGANLCGPSQQPRASSH